MKKVLGYGFVIYLVVQFAGAAVGAFAAVHYGIEIQDMYNYVTEQINATH